MVLARLRSIGLSFVLVLSLIGFSNINPISLNAEYCDPTQPETPSGYSRFFVFDSQFLFYHAITYVRIYP